MLMVLVACCLVGAALAGPPVSRSRSEIEKFRDFLESTRTEHGVVIGQSANPEASVWENSGKYQGDILLDDEQVESMIEQFASGRAAYIWPNTRWPSRTVVYEFASGQFSAAQRTAVLNTIQTIQQRTCIRFRPRNPGESNFVHLTTNSNGCFANVGYWATRGRHTMNLARNIPGLGCFNPIVIIHEWLHIIGFFHMQSTHNRDSYVRINWANIRRGTEHNFERYGTNMVSNLGLPYEYDSCMHYGPRAFTVNGRTTIDALRSHSGVMGQRSHVTRNDFLRVDRHYGCSAWRKLEDYEPYYDLPEDAEEVVAKEEDVAVEEVTKEEEAAKEEEDAKAEE